MSVDLNPRLLRFRVAAEGYDAVTGIPDLSGFAVARWYGIFHHPEGWTKTAGTMTDVAPCEAEGLLHATGEWIAVLNRTGCTSAEFLVLGDFFGHQRIFYSLGPDGVTVATDYDTLVRTVRHEGDLGINWEYFLPTLTAQNVFCAGAWARRTMHRNVRELFPGEALWVRPDAVSLVRKPFRAAAKKRTYESHLEAGITSAVEQLAGIARAHQGEIRLTLSGGRDSRVVLALALAAGLRNRLTIASSDPASFTGASRATVASDLHIAQAIAERYGIPNSIDGEHTPRTMTFQELIDSFQRDNSGGSYTLPSSLTLNSPVDSRVELRGGGGELLRGAFSAWHRTSWWESRIGNTRETLARDKRVLFDVVMRRGYLSNSLRERAIKVLSTALGEGDPESLAEGLSNHYHFHRNRWHFGQRLPALAENRLMVFPLEQPDLYHAANAMDDDLRRSGVVAYDIIAALEPSLNDYPFDNAPGWPEEIIQARGGCGNEGGRPPEATGDRISETLRTLRSNAVTRARKVSPAPFRPFTVATGRASLYLDLLYHAAPDQFTGTVRGQVAQLLRTGKLNPLQTVSRLHSALAPLLQVGHEVHSLVWDMQSDAPVQADPVVPTPGAVDVEGQDTALGVVAVREGAAGLKVEAVLSPDVSAQGWEFAFYILRGDERIHTRWYSSAASAEFVLDESGLMEGDLCVRAFARRSGTEDRLPLIVDAVVRPDATTDGG